MSTTITTPGLDVSHHQGVIDWAKVAAAGYKFAYAKATEGTDFVDAQFAANRIGARAHGLVFGAYHFARGGDIAAEASNFAAVVGQLQVGEFVVLDTEVPGAAGEWSHRWLDKVTSFWNTRPLIYMSDYYRRTYGWGPTAAGNYGLIAAKYDGTQVATDSAPWSVEAMRQYSSSGAVAGIAGPVDLDEFFGDVSTLLKYAKQGAPAPSPTPPPAPKPAPPSPQPGHFDVRSWRVSEGDTDAHLPSLQAWANRMFPAYRCTPIGPLSTHYGPQTAAFVREFGVHIGVPNDGKDIGPKVSAALYHLGWRG